MGQGTEGFQRMELHGRVYLFLVFSFQLKCQL